MEVRPGYKFTEVGVIPQDWKVTPLSSAAQRISRGASPRPIDSPMWFDNGSSIGWVRIADVTQAHRYLCETEQRLSEAGVRSSRFVPSGSLIMSICATVGRPIETRIDTCIHDGFVVFDTPAVDQSFLYHALTSLEATWSARGQTGSQMNLNTRLINSRTIALPPSETEQRAIAAALSDVDALLDGLDQLIAKKRDLKQATMQQLLTGQTRLKGFGPTKSFKRYAYGSIPDDWTTMPLSAAGTMSGRIGWQGLKQREFTDNPDDPFLITGMNFKDGKIRWDEVYHIPMKRYNEAPEIQLRPGDVLITKDGTIGKLLFVDEIPHPKAASLNSHLLVLRPAAGWFMPKFLFYQLASPPFAQHIELHKSGTTFFGLTQAATGKYPVVLPSIAEQTAIAEALTDMDADLSALGARRDKTRDLKQAMMQELLTGKTRLVPVGAAHA